MRLKKHVGDDNFVRQFRMFSRVVGVLVVANVKPFRSSAAPDATVVPEAVVPRGVFVAPPAAPSFNVPVLMVVKPV